ncbi:MAG: peptidoglycan DD-metalloendopeptidase family protein [Bacilli bacterium]|nr:peptidoglycan DD-metalloendopeptidase family protein [Bacilli bacterium]
MFNNDNKGLFGTAKEQMKKIKKVLTILPILGPILYAIFIVIIVVVITLLPIIFFNNIKDGFYNGVDKILNFISTGNWMSSENQYYLTLQDEYDKFQSYNYKEGEFDIPLLAATSHYANFFGPGNFDYANDESKDQPDEDEKYNEEDLKLGVKEELSRTFYRVAEHELGTSTTIIPTDKKLIGHLVDVKIVTHCTPLEDFGDAIDIAKIYWSQWKDFAKLTWYTVGKTQKTIIGEGNIVSFVKLLHAYKKHGYNYIETEYKQLVNVLKNDNIFFEIIRILDQSELGGCDADNEVPIPIIYRFINYENYKRYLKEFHLKDFYINCESCPHKNKSDKDKDIIADRMIDDIFNQKKLWDYLNQNQVIYQNTSAIYIPGLSSMPIPIGADGKLPITSSFGRRKHPITGEWDDHRGIDLGYAMGTPIYAMADGEVVHAGCQSNGCGKGWGKYVKIKHDINGDGKVDYYTLYAHMSVINTTTGAIVGGGQKIGEVGSTGTSTASHLHLEIHDSTGKLLNPGEVLKGIMEGNSIFDNTDIATYYYQGDFKNNAYCKGMGTEENESTIATAGALPTSYAMVAVKLGNKMTPVSIANYICQNTNYRVEEYGTSSAFFTDPNVINSFKIKATKMSNYTIDNLVSMLKSGKPIIASIKNGHFNPNGSGHYIVIDSIDADNNIKILDPGNRAKTNVSYSLEEIDTYVINHINGGMWYFEKG